MPSNLEFIQFAIKQMKDAVAFGFTPNLANRNLKISITQHWQNKTLGLHPQSQRGRIPRSNAALSKSTRQLHCEHVVPVQILVNLLIEPENPTVSHIEEILTRYFCVMMVTEEEHALLNGQFRFSMPPGWDGQDCFARYRAVGIGFDESLFPHPKL